MSVAAEELDALQHLTLDELQEVRSAEIAQHDAWYRAHFWEWLWDQVITIDEAAQKVLPWPRDKPYLQDFAYYIQHSRKLAIPKTRRMLATWLVAAYLVWRARYTEAVAGFWQSENEEKAAFVLDKRCLYIEQNLREPDFRRTVRTHKTNKGLVSLIEYELTKSYIWAIAEGGEKTRTFTPSILVIDEIEFQPQGHANLAAALPFAEKGAQLVVISSSNGPRGPLAAICRQASFTKFEG